MNPCNDNYKYIDGMFYEYDTNNHYHFLSDSEMCSSYRLLDDVYNKKNCSLLREMKYVPEYYKGFKDFGAENNLRFAKDNNTCDKNVILHRGDNNKTNVGLPPSEPFLIPYCPKNTHKNFIMADDKKGCSVSHQLFNNLTKRN